MSVYLDANVLVALFVIDAHTKRVEKIMRSLRADLVVSNLANAEFSAVIARRVRTRHLQGDEARSAFADFDIWCDRHVQRVDIDRHDFTAAIVLMRRLDFPLRTPDALHLVIAQRVGCALLTFDAEMSKTAQALGIELMKA